MESERLKKSVIQESPTSDQHDDKVTEPLGQQVGEGERFPMIAKTLAELEDVLAEELMALGAEDVDIGTRMVSFTGDKALMYKANLHCRTALRILKPIYNFKANSANEVYEAIKGLNWEEWLSLDTTFSIDSVVFSRIFTHSKFVTYRVKDAIADWFFERYGKRPSVSITNPDIALHVHIAHNRCSLSLDSSGESLHKRGYRIGQTEAPLNEVLAAGMILKSGWNGDTPFIDPMCGSGTLLIEAAMIALGIPPGIHRQHFAFEKWADFDQELFSTIYNDDSGARELKHPIIGSDISRRAIGIAEKNIKNAGLKQYIELAVKPMQRYNKAPAPTGVLITNPPYGERMKMEELDSLYDMIGERLKHVFMGYRAYVLSYRKESFDAIGLRHSKRFFLYNGALECEMREYEVFAGKREERPKKNAPREKRAHESDHYKRNSREGYRRSQRARRSEEEE
jgi:putative N6-adenine-specific DNA methylase